MKRKRNGQLLGLLRGHRAEFFPGTEGGGGRGVEGRTLGSPVV